MRKIFLSIIISLCIISSSYAVDITALPDLGTPATVSDSLTTYDSSAAEGSRITEIKFSADATEVLSGAGTWINPMTYPTSGQIGYTSDGSSWGTMNLDTDLSTVSTNDDSVPSAKSAKTALDLKQNIADVIEAEVDDVTLQATGAGPVVLSIKNDGVGADQLADGDYGDVTISGGVITVDAGLGAISIVDTEPTSPGVGDAWILTTDDKLYVRGTGGTWNSAALTWTADTDTTAPTISSATINGTSVVITFDEAVSQGTGWNVSQLDLDMSITGNDIGLTYVSGDGTTTHSFTAASAAVTGETVDLDFDGTADSLEDSSGNDLAAVVSQSVTNNTSGTSILYDFEEVGTPAGFSILNGTPDFDASGIDGESMLLDGYTAGSANSAYYTVSQTSGSMMWTRFELRCSQLPTATSGSLWLTYYGVAGTARANFYIERVAGTTYLAVQSSGGTKQVTSGTIAADTTYIVDIGYQKVQTTADSTAAIAFATSGEPAHSGSNYAASTNGTGDADMTRLTFGGLYSSATLSADCYIDNITESWED